MSRSIRLLAILTFAGAIAAGCSVADAPLVATVADVPRALPAPSTPVRGTVTDSRQGAQLLVELSDPGREEHIWVTGFARPPGRGEEVWTNILGPPVTNDLVGVAYPTSGPVPAPVSTSHVTPRSALAALLGGALVAVLAVLALVSATGWARRSGYRRCGGCSGAVESTWQTCPRCGTTLGSPAGAPAVPAMPPRGVSAASTPPPAAAAAPAPPPAPAPGTLQVPAPWPSVSSPADQSTRRTRITRKEPPP